MAGKLSVVVAIDQNNVIGTSDNKLPWKLPADLRMFKIITMGENIVMGSNTYRSLPGKLAGRKLHVLSKTTPPRPDEYALLKTAASVNNSVQDPFICGGVKMYDSFIPRADILYVTRVLTTVRGGNKALKAIKPINFERYHLIEEFPFLNNTGENEYPFVVQKWVSKRHFNKERMSLHTIISPELSVYESYVEDGEFWHNKEI